MADFRRDYQITSKELGELPMFEFLVYLKGLNAEARWWQFVKDNPQDMTEDQVKSAVDRL